MRRFMLGLSLSVLVTSAATAQTAWQFKAQSDQVLTYRMEHTTAVTEKTGDIKVTARSKINCVKLWKYLAAADDKAGARVELSYPALRMENTTPNGETLLFDSASLDKSTPELREQIKHVGKTVAVLRLDTTGKMIEVLECKLGAGTGFESDPPFDFVLPTDAPAVGATWERAYHITLAPPQGTNEKYDAVQKYVVKAIKDGKATIGVTTQIPKMPESALDQVPLLQKMWEGEVVFDIEAGRLHATRLKIDREIKNHQGEGSSYRFESSYTVNFVEAK